MSLETHLRKNENAMFNENLQVQFATSVEKALNSSGRTLVDQFVRPPMPVDEYLKLLNAAKEHFPLMNAICDYDDLDAYVAKAFGRDKQCYGLLYLSKSILDKLPHTRVALPVIVNDHQQPREVVEMASRVYQRFLAD